MGREDKHTVLSIMQMHAYRQPDALRHSSRLLIARNSRLDDAHVQQLPHSGDQVGCQARCRIRRSLQCKGKDAHTFNLPSLPSLSLIHQQQ
eukprot:scaffold57404_cov17-Prasinocladus_malaysianus.AAC.1